MKRWGFRYSGIFLILLTAIYILLTPALAHVPVFGGEGKTPETAISIEAPAKSQVLYGQLAAGDTRYYSFEIGKGERINLGLIVPVEQGNAGFTPDLFLIGPGLTDKGEIPDILEIPKGYGVQFYSGNLSRPVYEGFTPGAFYSLVRADLKAPESGKYYIAVSSAEEEGKYGIVVGYEETFTLRERISVPFNQIKIYQWEGQSLILILFPLGITLAAGLLAIYLRRETIAGFNPARISGVLAGLFFLGTGISYIFQMLISLSNSSYSPDIFITLSLILASLGLGVISLALSLKHADYGTVSTRKRLYFFILGIAGLLFWAGWLLGPLLAFEAALLPWKRKRGIK
jgi:hypothetical protein